MLYFDKATDSFIECDITDIFEENICDTIAWDMLFDEAYDTCKRTRLSSDITPRLTNDACEDTIPLTPIEFFMTQYGEAGFIESGAVTDGYSEDANYGSNLFFLKTA